MTSSANEARRAWTTPSLEVLSVSFDTAIYLGSAGDGESGSSYYD